MNDDDEVGLIDVVPPSSTSPVPGCRVPSSLSPTIAQYASGDPRGALRTDLPYNFLTDLAKLRGDLYVHRMKLVVVTMRRSTTICRRSGFPALDALVDRNVVSASMRKTRS